jgi:hypothetical protein
MFFLSYPEGWLGRASGAAQIGHDDGVLLREQRHDRAPHVSRLGIAVQQDHRAALSADEIAEPHAVDLGEAFGEACGPGRRSVESGHSTRPFRERIKQERATASRPESRAGCPMAGA